jgi:hypothetical protein
MIASVSDANVIRSCFAIECEREPQFRRFGVHGEVQAINRFIGPEVERDHRAGFIEDVLVDILAAVFPLFAFQGDVLTAQYFDCAVEAMASVSSARGAKVPDAVVVPDPVRVEFAGFEAFGLAVVGDDAIVGGRFVPLSFSCCRRRRAWWRETPARRR